MLNAEKIYCQTRQREIVKEISADRIVLAKAEHKCVVLTFLNENGQYEELLLGDSSLAQLRKHHPYSFAMVSRNLLIRRSYIEQFVEVSKTPPLHHVVVRGFDKPFPVSRRRVVHTRNALIKK